MNGLTTLNSKFFIDICVYIKIILDHELSPNSYLFLTWFLYIIIYKLKILIVSQHTTSILSLLTIIILSVQLIWHSMCWSLSNSCCLIGGQMAGHLRTKIRLTILFPAFSRLYSFPIVVSYFLSLLTTLLIFLFALHWCSFSQDSNHY